MSQLIERKSHAHPPHAAPWLDSLRQAAADRFLSVGYPTADEESWRFTNLAPIVRTQFQPAPSEPVAVSEAAADAAAAAGFGGRCLAELVFVNGHYAPSLSHPGKAPHGATIEALSAGNSDASLLQRHLSRQAEIGATPFVALNTGSFRDAAIIHIPRGMALESPIHVIYISDAVGEPMASHPRLLLVAEENSELALVESFVSAARGVTTLANSVAELFLGDDSRIDYNRIQQGTESELLVTMLSARLGRGARMVSHAATLGGRLTRNDLNVVLAGDGADATINGLAVLDHQQHCDNHTLLDHAAPNCPSHELYKHVLDGKSSCVFKGKILVRQDSQKTDSKQTSKSLLLSDEATMNSQPALEIYADDVKCTHGSTTGPVDEEMVFYLRSRGVGLEAARHLLTYAFAADVTRRIKIEPVRRRLEDFLAARHGLPLDLRITDLGQHDEKAR
ncbi:MAG: Fe-S cluster assembly protein SufD [Tepidisphaeraceae bacterium]|jgi:Fe-S cluster assembly protein SufD